MKQQILSLFFILCLATQSLRAAESSRPNEDEDKSSALTDLIFPGTSLEGQEKFHSLHPAGQGGWPRTLPSVSTVAKNYQRAIIHLHSVYSHDACDNKPFVNGAPDEVCFQDLQKELCDLKIDLAFLTEHSGHLSEFPFEQAWHAQPNDTPIMENGTHVGTIRTCPDGHRVHIYLGAENKLMPIGLTRHPDILPGKNLDETYLSRESDAVQNFHNAGALVGVAHTEDKLKTTEYLQKAGIDFLEIYNLHAEFLILLNEKNYANIFKQILNLLSFSLNPLLEPDLAFIGLQTENQAALDKWAAVALTQHITGTAGTDVHRNVTPAKLFDGERLDSYRRMQRWFSNYVYAPNPADRQAVLKSIREGKNLVVFETYGMPEGFDFTAETNQGTSQMGDMVTRSGHYRVRLQIPKLSFNGSTNTSAELEGAIFKATPKGWIQVAKGKASDSAMVEYQTDEPGVFRSEVLVKPNHLMRYMPGMFLLNRKHVWVYSNPIWIK